MDNKKILALILLAESFLFTSLYAKDKAETPTITAEAVKNGIKVKFKLKKSQKGINVYRYINQDFDDEDKQLVYENTKTKRSYTFVDEYVNEGQNYTYQLNVNNEFSNTVTATAGKGEAGIEIVPCDTGLQINVTNVNLKVPISKLYRYWAGEDRKNYASYATGVLRNYTVIDEYVDANREYIYQLKLFVKGNLGNDSYDHVFAPFKEIKITAPENGKYGDIVILNKPVANYDDKTKTITFTTIPIVGAGSNIFDYDRVHIILYTSQGKRLNALYTGKDSFVVDNPTVHETYRITGYALGVDVIGNGLSIYFYHHDAEDVFSEVQEIVK